MTDRVPTEKWISEHIPMSLWDRDHWSTLAYLETIQVNKGQIVVRSDPRMRQNRRHHRVLSGGTGFDQSIPMQSEHGSRLNDGTYAAGHDDWNCVQDMCEAGLVSGEIEPGAIIHLTPIGMEYCHQIREHKANGGSFGNFRPEEIVV